MQAPRTLLASLVCLSMLAQPIFAKSEKDYTGFKTEVVTAAKKVQTEVKKKVRNVRIKAKSKIADKKAKKVQKKKPANKKLAELEKMIKKNAKTIKADRMRRKYSKVSKMAKKKQGMFSTSAYQKALNDAKAWLIGVEFALDATVEKVKSFFSDPRSLREKTAKIADAKFASLSKATQAKIASLTMRRASLKNIQIKKISKKLSKKVKVKPIDGPTSKVVRKVTKKTARREKKLFTAKDSTEVQLTYDHYVEFSKSGGIDGNDEEDVQYMYNKIERQVSHIFGPMGHPLGSDDTRKAVPKSDHETEITSGEALGDNLYRIYYSYSGTAVVQDGGLGESEIFELYMPINPDAIYEQSRDGNDRLPCTDASYQSEGDFWYFWHPNKSGCELEEDAHYSIVEAEIERQDNETETYPEYDRLVVDDQITMSLFFGMDHPSDQRDDRDVDDTNDINASNYINVRDDLDSKGYESVEIDLPWDENVFSLEELRKYGSYEWFSKTTADNTLMVVKMYFGPTGINEDDNEVFHALYQDALENSSIMIYNGHSGLGGHLNLSSMSNLSGQDMTPNPDRYQIYYFNSCSSYPYYNQMYFEPKVTFEDETGTKNLDIVTNGLSTFFHVIDSTTIHFLNMVDAYAENEGTTSYQDFVDKADTNNLLCVNGDEDNE